MECEAAGEALGSQGRASLEMVCEGLLLSSLVMWVREDPDHFFFFFFFATLTVAQVREASSSPL